MSRTPEPKIHALVGGGGDASDVRHRTGFSAPDPFLCVLERGRAHLIVSELELGRARALPGAIVCHTPEELNLPRGRRGLGDQLAAFLRNRGRDCVSVSPRCPVGLVRAVESAGIDVRIRPDPQRPSRLRKTEAEIVLLRAAQRAAVAGVRSGREMIAASTVDHRGRLVGRDGKRLTSERVRSAIAHALLDHGCAAEDIIVAGGDQAVDPHEPGRGPLRAGEWIIVDVFPRAASGYWGDITRTVMKGKPTPERGRLFQTVLRAQTAALRQVRAGVRGDRIHGDIVRAFESAGYETGVVGGVPRGFIHSTGHGVGLDIHEAPRIAPGAGPLKAGMVVTIEPGLYYPGLGGVRIEDTVEVTETGCRPLARCRKDGVL